MQYSIVLWWSAHVFWKEQQQNSVLHCLHACSSTLTAVHHKQEYQSNQSRRRAPRWLWYIDIIHSSNPYIYIAAYLVYSRFEDCLTLGQFKMAQAKKASLGESLLHDPQLAYLYWGIREEAKPWQPAPHRYKKWNRYKPWHNVWPRHHCYFIFIQIFCEKHSWDKKKKKIELLYKCGNPEQKQADTMKCIIQFREAEVSTEVIYFTTCNGPSRNSVWWNTSEETGRRLVALTFFPGMSKTI